MKKQILLGFTMLCVALSTQAQLKADQAVVEMGRGINLGNTLDATNFEGGWATEAREYYFDMYAEAGFKTIRIPITWGAGTRLGKEAPYAIDEVFMARVDTIVEWTVSRGMFAIINVHHDEWVKNTETFDENKARFYAIWEQLSNHYKDYSEKLIFEIINEPHYQEGDIDKSITKAQVDELNKKALEIIRAVSPTRLTLFGGKSWSGSWDLLDAAIPDKEDEYLMAYYHSYDPYEFGLLGKGTWGSENDKKVMEDQMKNVQTWSQENGIPVLIGEFGATAENRQDWNSQMRYYAHYAESALKYDFAFCVWDDDGYFQILDRKDTSWNEIKDIVIHSSDSSPVNIMMEILDDTVISISWEDRATSKLKTTIERKTLRTDFAPIGIMKQVSGTVYHDKTAEVGMEYIYRLVEVFADAEIPSYPQKAFLMSTERSPYHGEAMAIPGTIEAEDYDLGGEGLTFHDTDPENVPGAYRPDEAVDIEERPEGNAYQVGYVAQGEWIEYTVNVAEAGDYTIIAHTATTNADGEMGIDFKGKEVAKVAIPNTGSWTELTQTRTNVTLEAGEQIMRINILSENPFNIDKLEIITYNAVEDLTINQLNLYPNPVSDRLFVQLQSAQTINNVEILDLNGRTIETIENTSNQLEINTSQYENGVYILVVSTSNSVITKKFMVK